MKPDFPLVRAYYKDKGWPAGHIPRGAITHLASEKGKPVCLSHMGFRNAGRQVKEWRHLTGYPSCQYCQHILERQQGGAA